MKNKLFRIASYAIISSCLLAGSIRSSKADDGQIVTPFSSMAANTYEGYPLFPQGEDSNKFHYAASGIDVKGSYSEWTGVLTYTVSEGDKVVTRSDYLSHSGYRMIHGVDYSQNLFVVSYR